ncbi:MAG: cohesin domain-containing protein, partial [Bacteroidota bacterium]
MIRPVHAQGPVVAIGSATSCTSGTVVTVPITVQNFNNIGAVSLDMLYDSTKLTYTGFNSAALSGNLIVNNPGPTGSPFGRVLISWFSLTAANIGNGLLMNVTFTANGSSSINWNTAVVGQCELADGNGEVIPSATFTNGSVTVGGAAISTQPVSNLALANGASGSLSVVANGESSYQWKVSLAGVACNNLTNGGGYSGVTTSTLGIVAASAMNGNQYRVQVSGGTCPAVISNVSTLNVSVPIVLATVSTNAVSLVTSTGATTGGNVTSDGGAAITARGVAYGTSQSPTISGTTTSNGTGTGSFSSTLTGLTSSTVYYVRAYATNSVGTAYGSQVSFTTSAAPVVVLGQVSGCRGTVVTVPITVQNFTNIGAVSLDLLYDSTKLTYTGNNSSALTGNLIVNNPTTGGTPQGRVLITWFDINASNIGSGLMLNLTFTVNGSSALNWNTAVAGQCELADGNGDVISGATFTNGSVTATGAQITTQPTAALSLNAGVSGSLSVVASGASSYQWQVSVAGGAWTNLTNGSGYSGVTTTTLGIVAAGAMNGNQYRVLVSGGGCADVPSSVTTLTVNTPA